MIRPQLPFHLLRQQISRRRTVANDWVFVVFDSLPIRSGTLERFSIRFRILGAMLRQNRVDSRSRPKLSNDFIIRTRITIEFCIPDPENCKNDEIQTFQVIRQQAVSLLCANVRRL
jgi:hypothetical protein